MIVQTFSLDEDDLEQLELFALIFGLKEQDYLTLFFNFIKYWNSSSLSQLDLHLLSIANENDYYSKDFESRKISEDYHYTYNDYLEWLNDFSKANNGLHMELNRPELKEHLLVNVKCYRIDSIVHIYHKHISLHSGDIKN